MKVRILREAAKSKQQQQYMGMVHNCQETGECPSDEIEKTASSMTKKDVEDFTSTKHKGLPKTSKNEEQLEEITAAGNVAGAAGGFPSKVVKDFNDKEKEDSELNGKPMTEMFSTSQMKSSVLDSKGLTIYLRGRRKEHDGYIEKSKYQGLKNVMENDE